MLEHNMDLLRRIDLIDFSPHVRCFATRMNGTKRLKRLNLWLSCADCLYSLANVKVVKMSNLCPPTAANLDQRQQNGESLCRRSMGLREFSIITSLKWEAREAAEAEEDEDRNIRDFVSHVHLCLNAIVIY